MSNKKRGEPVVKRLIDWDALKKDVNSGIVSPGGKNPYQVDRLFLEKLCETLKKNLISIEPWSYYDNKLVSIGANADQYFFSDLTENFGVWSFSAGPPVLPVPTTGIDKLYFGKLELGIGENPQGTGATVTGTQVGTSLSVLRAVRGSILPRVLKMYSAISVGTVDFVQSDRLSGYDLFTHAGGRFRTGAASTMGVYVYMDFVGWRLNVKPI